MAQWVGAEWCFTINAPKDSDEPEAEEFLNEFYERCRDLDCKYLVVKGEIGESGNYHLQGFVMFNQKRRFREIKEMFACGSMHLEKRANRSTNAQAANYVKKVETAWDLFPLIEKGAIVSENSGRCPRASSTGPWTSDGHWKQCADCLSQREKDLAAFEAMLEQPITSDDDTYCVISD